jgi:hypothetical protein
MRPLGVLAAALLAPILAAAPVLAQIPTATGTPLPLSNAAWNVFIPSSYVQRPGNVADVLVHFHGNSQVFWNNAAYANLNAIIVTVNYSGLSSAYSTPFSNSALFQQILDESLTKVRQQASIPDNLVWDKLAVSSFSAGYGAVREILKSASYRNDIDMLLAADSLYAGTAGDGTPNNAQLADYTTFANLAKNGSKTFIYSHSQVPTPGYESTGECIDEIMQSIGVATTPFNANGLGTLNFYRKADAGNFHVLGALGSDGDSHLEHLRYIGEYLEDLPLAKLSAGPMAGDYNNNGTIDTADYVLWRNMVGGRVPLPNDGGVSPGITDYNDYNYWRSRYALGAGSGSLNSAAAVPEPAFLALLFTALTLPTFLTRPRRNGRFSAMR